MDRQLPGLAVSAGQRPDWPVRGELIVDGAVRAVFMFVAPGMYVPWMAWVLEPVEPGPESERGSRSESAETAFRFAPMPGIEIHGLMVDWASPRTSLDGDVLDLTPLEARLLTHFAKSPGIAFCRRDLLECTHGHPLWA
jgi:hypothetical protein